MARDFSSMSDEELVSLGRRLSKSIDVPDDKKNPEVHVDSGKGNVQEKNTPSSLDTQSPDGSKYSKVTKPTESGKSMKTEEDGSQTPSGDGTEITPMSGGKQPDRPGQFAGPKAEEKREEHDLPPQAQSAIPGKREQDDETECPPGAMSKGKKVKIKMPPLAEEYMSKLEEAQSFRSKLEEECTRMKEELEAIQGALAGTDGQPPAQPPTPPAPAPRPAPSQAPPAPPAPAPKPPAMEQPPVGAAPAPGMMEEKVPEATQPSIDLPDYLCEEEDDEEAQKALKKRGRELFSALKSITDTLGKVDEQAGGPIDPSHPQPSPMINAEPGKSGSSGVFREEKGKKPDLDLTSSSVNTDESGGNPKKLVENAKGSDPKDVSGVYDKPTELVTGIGYTGKGTGQLEIQKISQLRPSWKELGRDKTMPMLKHMMSGRIPTPNEVEQLAKSGELLPELTKEYRLSIEKSVGPNSSLMRKALVMALSD